MILLFLGTWFCVVPCLPTTITASVFMLTSSTRFVVPCLPEASSRIYTAGDVVRGRVELSLEGKDGEGPTIQEVSVSLRCHQVSTYLMTYGNGTVGK
jgi:hypothetical protein